MSDNEANNNDDDVELFPTYREARRRQKQYFARLKKSNRREDRLLGKALEKCKKGNRCNQPECPVCERRQKIAANRIDPIIRGYASWLWSNPARKLHLSDIKVIGKRRSLNKEKVRGIASSMELVGLQTPITVRTTKTGKAILVTGLHRLEAARRLGWKNIYCRVVPGDEAETRPWQIAENLQRAELTVLERSEYIDELRVSMRQQTKGKQVAPPGGQQPSDSAIKKTARAHGLTKEEVGRAKAIASISLKAKAAAKDLGLDNNQGALLQIAKMPTDRTQVEQAHAIYENYSVTRSRRVAQVVDEHPEAAAKITDIEAEIGDKENKVAKLNKQVASRRRRIRDIEDGLIEQPVDVASMTVASPGLVPFEEADSPLPAENKTTPIVTAEDDPAFTDLVAAWQGAEEFRRAWDQAPELARDRFISIVLKGERHEVQ